MFTLKFMSRHYYWQRVKVVAVVESEELAVSEKKGSAAVQVEARKQGRTVTVSVGATASKEPHPFGWRDAMDIVVKWRQLSEPNDQASIWHSLQETQHAFTAT